MNVVFDGWPPSEMDKMRLAERMRWYDEAVRRHEADDAK
ncbi:MAG: GpE family phage tail protein [Pseudomonadota bacterium]|nr:GpE family phage tail protein [Pseudomonadota bacterium]